MMNQNPTQTQNRAVLSKECKNPTESEEVRLRVSQGIHECFLACRKKGINERRLRMNIEAAFLPSLLFYFYLPHSFQRPAGYT